MVLRFFQFYSQARVKGEDGHVFTLCVLAISCVSLISARSFNGETRCTWGKFIHQLITVSQKTACTTWLCILSSCWCKSWIWEGHAAIDLRAWLPSMCSGQSIRRSFLFALGTVHMSPTTLFRSWREGSGLPSVCFSKLESVCSVFFLCWQNLCLSLSSLQIALPYPYLQFQNLEFLGYARVQVLSVYQALGEWLPRIHKLLPPAQALQAPACWGRITSYIKLQFSHAGWRDTWL